MANIYVSPTGIRTKERLTWLAGAAAGNVTLTGITTDDQILEVHHIPAPTTTGSVAIEHTVTAGEDTANSAAIDTGLGATLGAYVVQVRTAAGVNHPLTDAAVSKAAGVVTIADGAATFVLTATDIVTILASPAATASVQGTAADLSSEFTITAANTINNTGGTASTNGLLLVKWYDTDYGDIAEVP